VSPGADRAPLPDAVADASFSPTPPPVEQPSRRWWGRHLAELRWQAELGRLFVDPVYHGRGVPRGDGAPVVLIPGFLAGDVSLAVMHGWLRAIGHDPHFAGMLANVACSDRALDRLDVRVEEIHRRTGRPVALLGHSRGAHFAKALASRRPERIASVISLGSGLDHPFDISVPTKGALSVVRALHARTTDRVARNGCLTDTCRCAFARDYAATFPGDVPLTSIYSRGDGVVWWEACVVPYARCVEVTGSHVGLAFNRKAYREIASTLHASAERAAPATQRSRAA
jgi:triacylglycerol lipase